MAAAGCALACLLVLALRPGQVVAQTGRGCVGGFYWPNHGPVVVWSDGRVTDPSNEVAEAPRRTPTGPAAPRGEMSAAAARLHAGNLSEALKRWLDDHQHTLPKGIELIQVLNDVHGNRGDLDAGPNAVWTINEFVTGIPLPQDKTVMVYESQAAGPVAPHEGFMVVIYCDGTVAAVPPGAPLKWRP